MKTTMPNRQQLIISLVSLAILSGLVIYWIPSGDSGEVVRVDVAASLQPVVKELATQFEERLPGRARISSAGSQTVARQVVNGKETDLVFLANERWMDYVGQHDRLVPGTRRTLLGNRLVLIGPRSDTTIRSVGNLREFNGSLALGNVRAVPAGIYARKSLESMRLWDNRSFETVMFPHVRAVLSAVASGNVPAGIVYRTDLRRETGIRRIATLPEEHVPPIRYPIARVEGASKLSRDWYRAFLGDTAHETYSEYGFEVVDQ
jgi:molybdate transport system substrate-binding protein